MLDVLCMSLGIDVNHPNGWVVKNGETCGVGGGATHEARLTGGAQGRVNSYRGFVGG
jgi:hypothetical protein